MTQEDKWAGTLFAETQKRYDLSRERVWYGFTKLTKKAVRKRELAIFYENGGSGDDTWIAKRMHIAYTRRQTIMEAEDGKNSNRAYTKFGYFIDDKKFKGDINAVLLANYEADNNNVPENERKEIMKCLSDKYLELTRIGLY